MVTHVEMLPGPSMDRAVTFTLQYPERGLSEILSAVVARRIGLTLVLDPRFAWSPRMIKSTLPSVVLIGDDRGNSRNPDQWRCAISAIAWARCAIVHGTGDQLFHYREAVRAALAKGRCLFIETDSDHVDAWMAAIALRAIPILTIRPPKGAVHPEALRG
ncbi:MAG TPA: hypothetical protein VHA37_05550 [Candidatus Saccharimonadales bacterium]|nr:hypothetical protein [Candidatus Saccharimonadales bacterium]